MEFKKVSPKPNFPEMERKILEYWEKNKIFEKSLKKPSPEGDFVFYEGPPTANGKPGVHHVEARAFKDLFPRYKTMQGYRVERKAGWDTHGLPVELEVEKSLGFSGKRDIEKYGIEKFNKKCAASVWKYKEEWEKLTKRMGYWVDLEHPYITCSNEYIESVWFILKKIWEKELLYQGHKVVPYCPRCGTALSSHEVAQGYRKVKEESVFIKFKIRTPLNLPLERGEKSLPLPEGEMEGVGVYFLAWTTTPWTLPGNVALALGEEIEYVLIEVLGGKGKIDNCRGLIYQTRGRDESRPYKEYLILAKERLEILDGDYEIIQEFKGKDLAGIEYEPLYPVFTGLSDLSDSRSCRTSSLTSNNPPCYQTVLADFVTTEEGTGIVHTAVMYGEDDYELGKKLGLPMRHTVDEQGKFKFDFFKKGMDSSSPDKGRAGGVLEKEEETPLKSPLVRGEGGIEGVFVKDAEKDIVEDLRKRDLLYKSELYEHDYPFCWRCKTPLLYYAKKSWFIAMSKLRDKLVENNEKINWIPKYLKTGRFGKWIAEAKDWAVSRERYWGTPLPIWICKKCEEVKVVGSREELYSVIASGAKPARQWLRQQAMAGGQSPASKTEARNVGTLSLLNGDCRGRPSAGSGLPRNDDILMDLHRPYIDKVVFKCKCGGEMRRVPEVLDCWFDSGAMPFAQNHWPFNSFRGLTHRSTPTFGVASVGADQCVRPGGDPLPARSCLAVAGGQLPLRKGESIPPKLFPADFICEAVDQTRGWFYTLLAISTLLDFGPPYKNVISLGHVLDKNGQKMSKSRGNIIDPFKALDEFSADSIRWFFYTVNRPQESKNFDPAILRDIVSRFILTLWNSYSFFLTYASIDQPNVGADQCVRPKIDLCVNPQKSGEHKGSLNGRIHGSEIGRTHWSAPTGNILDHWILSRLAELNNNIVQYLNRYDVLKAAKEIEQFVDDLSNWYIRRSRRRFWKSENDQDKDQGYNTLHSVLVLLCEMLAPFMPFITESIYRNLTGKESVHLAKFPNISSEGIDQKILEQMDITRKIVTLGLNLRAQAKIRVRQPIASLKIKNQKSRLRRGFGGQAKIKNIMQNLKLLDLMKEELNVKKIELTKEIKEEESWIIGEEDGIKVALNIKITPELKREGIIRDLVRAVQEMRKKAGLEVSDRIRLSLYSEDREIQKAIQEWQEYIQKETLARGLEIRVQKDGDGEKVKIGDNEVTINLKSKIENLKFTSKI